MTKNKLIKLLAAILVLVGIFLAGFLLGRSKVPDAEIKVVTKYEKLPPIHDTIYQPKPYKVIAPADTLGIIVQCINDGIYSELFPEKVVENTVYMTSEDTLKIVADWATKRLYSETLFDNDTIGTCTIALNVQYNRVGEMIYDFTPVVKEVTITKTRVRAFEPFVGATLFLDNKASVEAGVYFKSHYGVSVLYGHDFGAEAGSLGLGFRYKF